MKKNRIQYWHIDIDVIDSEDNEVIGCITRVFECSSYKEMRQNCKSWIKKHNAMLYSPIHYQIRDYKYIGKVEVKE